MEVVTARRRGCDFDVSLQSTTGTRNRETFGLGSVGLVQSIGKGAEALRRLPEFCVLFLQFLDRLLALLQLAFRLIVQVVPPGIGALRVAGTPGEAARRT
jgi:hypothetical protein